MNEGCITNGTLKKVIVCYSFAADIVVSCNDSSLSQFVGQAAVRTVQRCQSQRRSHLQEEAGGAEADRGPHELPGG